MISNRANSQVRAPAVAGTFYPRSAKTLSATVADLLFAADVDQRPRRCGVIAPHAGYLYSGAIAGSAFALLRNAEQRPGRRVVLVGPSHWVEFEVLALSEASQFATPFGSVRVDRVHGVELSQGPAPGERGQEVRQGRPAVRLQPALCRLHRGEELHDPLPAVLVETADQLQDDDGDEVERLAMPKAKRIGPPDGWAGAVLAKLGN